MSHQTNTTYHRHKGSRQTHLNKLKFDPNRHKDDHDKVDKSFLDVMTTLCCRRCCDQLQWKVDYGKFVPLERPRRCNICAQKNVAIAYHRICQDCSIKTAKCAKCQKCPADKGEGGAVSDDSDADEEERPSLPTKELDEDHILNKYAFIDQPIQDEEFAHLQGLDVRRVLNHKRKLQILREKESRADMRERERRSHIRAEKKKNEGVDELASEKDSDEEM
eukprot:GDKJ01047533.1.p1 GENE.GDKJ01047533.1~~GDKJ01047533.1.p1  ORF type:complete len:220 (-),score=29.80 GDKJ01047533.1:89-748(-)